MNLQRKNWRMVGNLLVIVAGMFAFGSALVPLYRALCDLVRPMKSSLHVHPGEMATVMHEFQNVQDRRMSAQAIPGYAPSQTAAHFSKVECFCFNEYTLAPGEQKEWPAVFVIDPRLSKDVTTIILFYTFFEVRTKTPGLPASTPASPSTTSPGGKQET